MRTPTLAELLTDGQHLLIWCCWPGCNRQVRLSAEDAIARLGGACTIRQAQRRLYCAGCGHRGRDKWVDCMPDPNDAAALRQAARGDR